MSKWGCIPAEAEDSQTVVEAAEADHHAGQGMWTQLWQFPHHHPTPNLLAHLHTPPHKVGHFFWPPAWCAAKGVVNFGTNRTATTLSAHICHRQDSPPGAERRWQNIYTQFYSAKRSVKFLKKRVWWSLRFSEFFFVTKYMAIFSFYLWENYNKFSRTVLWENDDKVYREYDMSITRMRMISKATVWWEHEFQLGR